MSCVCSRPSLPLQILLCTGVLWWYDTRNKISTNKQAPTNQLTRRPYLPSYPYYYACVRDESSTRPSTILSHSPVLHHQFIFIIPKSDNESAAPRAFRVGSKEEEPFFGSLPENQWLPHHFIKIHPPSELQIPRTRWSTKDRGVNQLKSCLN